MQTFRQMKLVYMSPVATNPQALKPTVSLKLIMGEYPDAMYWGRSLMREIISGTIKSIHSFNVLQCLNKRTGNSRRPTILFQCWKCEQFIRVWTLFPSRCLLPFVTSQQSSFQGCSVTQRPSLHFSSWQESPVKRELGALGCCGRRHWAHPSSILGEWWQ